MTKITIAIILASVSTVATNAATFNYSCKDNNKSYPLRVDTKTNILEWKGNQYSISEANNPDSDKIVCAKAGWHAEGNGTSFDFCTATQGYADIEKDGNVQVQCDLKRR